MRNCSNNADKVSRNSDNVSRNSDKNLTAFHRLIGSFNSLSNKKLFDPHGPSPTFKGRVKYGQESGNYNKSSFFIKVVLVERP